MALTNNCGKESPEEDFKLFFFNDIFNDKMALTNNCGEESPEENIKLVFGEAGPHILYEGVHLAQTKHSQGLPKGTT